MVRKMIKIFVSVKNISLGDMCRICDILFIMLLQRDTTRIHQQIFSDINPNVSHSLDDIYVGDVNEVAFDEGNNEDYEDEYPCDYEGSQEETNEKNRVCLF
jgi:hypothetical protein